MVSDIMHEIKSMKLYTHIDRVHSELTELGKEQGSSLTAEEISTIDQMHYHGTASVSHAIDTIGITQDHKVLEIGAGFGGPARHIADQTQAKVTAIELQSDQNELAKELTQRCGLADKVDHVCDDFLDYDNGENIFDSVVSWLAIFHIPDRPRLLQRANSMLKSKGIFFAEDMYSRNPMEEWEKNELGTGMFASYLPDFDQYKTDFEDNGFEILEVEEMSDDWTNFTTDRLNDYRTMRDRHVRIHGEVAFSALEEFYDLVNRHFRSGKLGGIRIMSRKID
jgi:cyclopropane fatty-acyl-phospholipid synthase-like methyltransferase